MSLIVPYDKTKTLTDLLLAISFWPSDLINNYCREHCCIHCFIGVSYDSIHIGWSKNYFVYGESVIFRNK